MRVEINMRPYPEQKPPEVEDTHFVLIDGRFHAAMWLNFDGCWRFSRSNVTHFVLNRDITITEEKREG